MRRCDFRSLLPAAFLVLLAAVHAQSATQPIQLNVDVTDGPRKILHAVETMPITPGAHTLVYPKWIPGEHGPTGPIDDLTGIVITANGQPIPWRRDDVDMFAFHIDVPAGATGAMGAITPLESGYYPQKLVRVDGQWLIESLQVRHNLPFAF